MFEHIDPNSISEACARLRLRLISHGMGLLDVIPSKVARVQCHDQRNLFKVQFHHHTVQEFLPESECGQKLIAEFGCKEQDIHLSIARGHIRFIYHEAWNHVDDDKVAKVDSLVYFSALIVGLAHLTYTEELIRTPQSRLMQSLCDDFLIPVARTRGSQHDLARGQFILSDGKRATVDFVSLAASAGMWRWVCEVLELNAVEYADHEGIPAASLQLRSVEQTSKAVINVSIPTDLVKLNLNYRQNMCKSLSWHINRVLTLVMKTLHALRKGFC